MCVTFVRKQNKGLIRRVINKYGIKPRYSAFVANFLRIPIVTCVFYMTFILFKHREKSCVHVRSTIILLLFVLFIFAQHTLCLLTGAYFAIIIYEKCLCVRNCAHSHPIIVILLFEINNYHHKFCNVII